MSPDEGFELVTIRGSSTSGKVIHENFNTRSKEEIVTMKAHDRCKVWNRINEKQCSNENMKLAKDKTI